MILSISGALVAAATGFQLMRANYEEPEYEVVAEPAGLEVRRYAERVVAQTTVSGTEDAVTSEGFRRLAGYIFGGNDGSRSIAMTTPVERAPEGTQIAMTTPVERTEGDGGWVVTFTMPDEYSLETLPQPNDSRVSLRELPPRTVAVLRFRGRANPDMARTRTAELLRRMRDAGYEAAGEPSLAQYDPPWVLGPFRRNEVLCEVRVAS